MAALYKLGRPYAATKLENVRSMEKIMEELDSGPRMKGTLKGAISDHPYPPGASEFLHYLIKRGFLVEAGDSNGT